MNNTTYIIRRNKLNAGFRKYMKANKALKNDKIDRKDFDMILGEYNALCKMYQTEEYFTYKQNNY